MDVGDNDKKQPAGGAGDLDLQRQITYVVSRLNAKLTAQAARLLRKRSDLSLTQWRVMVILDAWGQGSLAEMCRFLLADKGQLSRVTQVLVERGMLASEPSETDHRVHILKLTDTGRAAYLKAAPHMARRRDHLLTALSREEQDVFFALLDKLNAAADDFENAL